MGQLNRGVIVSEGLQLMGRPDLTLRANVWLNTFLGNLYAGYDWPFLMQRIGPLTLAQGASLITLGAGTLTPFKLDSIKKIAIADAQNNGMKGVCEVVAPSDVAPADDPAWANTSALGVPTKFIVEIDQTGTGPFRWLLRPMPLPNKAYRIMVQVKIAPDHLTADANVPTYPNDDTLVFGVYVAALRHQQDERFAIEDSKLQAMIRQDRVVHGRASGSSKKWQMGGAHKTRQRSGNWMGD